MIAGEWPESQRSIYLCTCIYVCVFCVLRMRVFSHRPRVGFLEIRRNRDAVSCALGIACNWPSFYFLYFLSFLSFSFFLLVCLLAIVGCTGSGHARGLSPRNFSGETMLD